MVVLEGEEGRQGPKYVVGEVEVMAKDLNVLAKLALKIGRRMDDPIHVKVYSAAQVPWEETPWWEPTKGSFLSFLRREERHRRTLAVFGSSLPPRLPVLANVSYASGISACPAFARHYLISWAVFFLDKEVFN